MNVRIIGVILKKELRDLLRDKGTLLMVFVLPLVIYPLYVLFPMFDNISDARELKGATKKYGDTTNVTYRIAIQSDEQEVVRGWFTNANCFQFINSTNPAKDIIDRKLDTALIVTGAVAGVLSSSGTVHVAFKYNPMKKLSKNAMDSARGFLYRNVTSRIRTERLKRAGMSENAISPLDLDIQDVGLFSGLINMVMPLILFNMILICAAGAMTMAVDLTAGEKERGTLETLLTAPITKLELIMGKFTALFLLVLVMGVLQVVSMTGTAFSLFAQIKLSSLTKLSEMPELLSLFTIMKSNMGLLLLIGGIVLFFQVFFISASILSVAMFGHSVKQSQTYCYIWVGVMSVVSLFPVFMNFMNAEPSMLSQFIPLAGGVLALKTVVSGGSLNVNAVFLASVSMLLYGAIALLVAVKFYQRGEVLLAGQGGMSFTFRRREFQPRSVLSTGGALALFGMIMLLLISIGSVAQAWRLLVGVLITQWGLILFPTIVFLWFVRIDLRNALSLRRLSWAGLAGTLLISLSIAALMIEYSVWQDKVMPAPDWMEKIFKDLFSAHGQSLPGVLLVVLAISLTPAVCEETLFRGALLSGLRARIGGLGAVILTAVLFGIFHLTIYKLLSTALIGLALGYLVVRTGSIFSGMLMHALNNGMMILLMFMNQPPAVSDRLFDVNTFEKSGLPFWVIIIAVVMLVLGVLIIERSRRSKSLSQT